MKSPKYFGALFCSMAFYLFSYHVTFDAEKWLEMKNVK